MHKRIIIFYEVFDIVNIFDGAPPLVMARPHVEPGARNSPGNFFIEGRPLWSPFLSFYLNFKISHHFFILCVCGLVASGSFLSPWFSWLRFTLSNSC